MNNIFLKPFSCIFDWFTTVQVNARWMENSESQKMSYKNESRQQRPFKYDIGERRENGVKWQTMKRPSELEKQNGHIVRKIPMEHYVFKQWTPEFKLVKTAFHKLQWQPVEQFQKLEYP